MAEIRHTLEALINPLFLVYVLIIISLYLSWQLPWSRGCLLMVVLILSLFSTYWLPALLTGYLESLYPPIKKIDPSVTNIVILSGGQADVIDQPADMVLHTATMKRVLTGIRIWKDMPNGQIILSGGGYGHQIAEATVMKQLAEQCGVSSSAIDIEDQSINTADQARILKQALADKPFYLVTSAIHMPRSMALFRDQGMHPIAASADLTYYWQDERWQKRYIPNAHNLVYTEIAIHELLGLLQRSIMRLFTKK